MATAYISGENLWCMQSPGCELEDIDSRIVCQDIRILPCGGSGTEGDCPDTVVNNGFILCDCGDSYNCNLCGNDLPYNHPLAPGDPIYIQFQQVDVINGQSPALDPVTGLWGQGKGWGTGMMEGFIVDCCTQERLDVTFSDLAGAVYVGLYESTGYNGEVSFNNIQQGWVNSSLICAALAETGGNGCFYFEFEFYDAEGAVINTFCSEPYQCQTCQDLATVQLEGIYGGRDCFGLFYGSTVGGIGIGTPFIYRNIYRVPGVFEPGSFEIVKEFVGTYNRTTSSELIENWVLRTSGIPRRVARYIANILSSPEILVDGVGYTMEGEIPRNNDIGSSWYIEAPFKSVKCAKNFSCND